MNRYKRQYGSNVIVTRLGKITEVTAEEISGEAWEDDCPLCQMFKDEPHDIIYPA